MHVYTPAHILILAWSFTLSYFFFFLTVRNLGYISKVETSMAFVDRNKKQLTRYLIEIELKARSVICAMNWNKYSYVLYSLIHACALAPFGIRSTYPAGFRVTSSNYDPEVSLLYTSDALWHILIQYARVRLTLELYQALHTSRLFFFCCCCCCCCCSMFLCVYFRLSNSYNMHASILISYAS